MLHSPSSAILILILRTGYFVEGAVEWESSEKTGEGCVKSGADCSSFIFISHLILLNLFA